MLLLLDQFAQFCRERVRFGLMKVGGLAFDKNPLFARRSERQPAENEAREKNGRQKYQSVAFQGSITNLLLALSLSVFKTLCSASCCGSRWRFRGRMWKDSTLMSSLQGVNLVSNFPSVPGSPAN